MADVWSLTENSRYQTDSNLLFHRRSARSLTPRRLLQLGQPSLLFHALFAEVHLYSQPAIFECHTKLHRTSRRYCRSSVVRSLDSAEYQSTRTPLRRHRDPAHLRCIRRPAATPPRPIFSSSRTCTPSLLHCGWPSESSSPPSYNRRFSDALVHVNDAAVRASVCHGCRLEAIILRQVCTHRVYDRMGAPTSTVIKHRVNAMRKPSAVLFAEQQESYIQARCR